MDQELDRAIDAALAEVGAVKPAADFLPRLRARVEQAPAATPIRWWIPFTASATAVIAGVIVAALVRAPRIERTGSNSASTEPVAARPTPAPAESASRVVVPGSETRTPRPVRSRVRSIPRAVQDRDSAAVLVPPGQLAVIGRLLDAINAGDDHIASAVRKLHTGTAIEIAPIRIEPLIVPSMKESS